MKCEYCVNSRPIFSENGMHPACYLTSQQIKKCLMGQKDYFEERPCISKILIEEKNEEF